MLPLIQKELEQLRYLTGEFVFSQVMNLNDIIESPEEEKILRSAFEYYSPNSNFVYPEVANSLRSRIFNSITSPDLFLTIKINSLENLIEYQLSLYSILSEATSASDESNFFPFKVLDKALAVNSFFIDPTDKNYQKLVYTGVRKIFPFANNPPVAKILINKNILVDTVSAITFWAQEGDSLQITAKESYDIDDDPESLNFKWKTYLLDSGHYDGHMVLKPYTRDQVIYCDNAGRYRYSLTVGDGVSNSKEIFFEIQVIKKLKLLPVYDSYGDTLILTYFTVARNEYISQKTGGLIRNSKSSDKVNKEIYARKKSDVVYLLEDTIYLFSNFPEPSGRIVIERANKSYKDSAEMYLDLLRQYAYDMNYVNIDSLILSIPREGSGKNDIRITSDTTRKNNLFRLRISVANPKSGIYYYRAFPSFKNITGDTVKLMLDFYRYSGTIYSKYQFDWIPSDFSCCVIDSSRPLNGALFRHIVTDLRDHLFSFSIHVGLGLPLYDYYPSRLASKSIFPLPFYLGFGMNLGVRLPIDHNSILSFRKKYVYNKGYAHEHDNFWYFTAGRSWVNGYNINYPTSSVSGFRNYKFGIESVALGSSLKDFRKKRVRIIGVYIITTSILGYFNINEGIGLGFSYKKIGFFN